MNTSSRTIRRLARATGLAASLAVLAVPTALAGGQSDTLDPAIAAAIASHRASTDGCRRVSRSTRAIAAAIDSHRASPKVADARSRDTLDPAIAAAIASHRASLTDAGSYRLDPAIAAAIAARKAS